VLFAFFSGKRGVSVGFLGPAPDPVVPLRGRFGVQDLLRRTNAFCFFFWKEKSIGGLSK
jgi:hypothetical protein